MNARHRNILRMAGAVCAFAALLGCAEKKPARKLTRPLDLRAGKQVTFKGIRDGHCEIADVTYDVKIGYVVTCK